VGDVVVEVLEELVLGNVLRERGWKWLVGKLAEVLAEMEVETVVGVFLPKRSETVFSLKDYVRNGVLGETCGGGKA